MLRTSPLELVAALVALLLCPLVHGEVPRRYACPMHADVRRAEPGACPRCGMALVPVKIDDLLEPYLLDLTVAPPEAPATRPLTLTFRVRDPATREEVHDFATVHEQLLHLFIVSQDLRWFAHVHPTLGAGGRFTLEQAFPRAGSYQLIADFVPAGGAPQLLRRSLIIGGGDGPLRRAQLPRREITRAEVDGLTAQLSGAGLIATRTAALDLTLSSPAGRPVTTEPYLGADVHVLAVSEDLADVLHVHGDRAEGPAGALRLELCFPRPGAYRLWAQVKSDGVVRTFVFTVSVKAMAGPG